MRQESLFHDSLEEAIKDALPAMGGVKSVGYMLWPAKKPADAARQLNHCLEPNIPVKAFKGNIMERKQQIQKEINEMHRLIDTTSFKSVEKWAKERLTTLTGQLSRELEKRQ